MKNFNNQKIHHYFIKENAIPCFVTDHKVVSHSNQGQEQPPQPHAILELNQQRPVFRNYRLLMNGTLYISKATEADEGKFVCEADNGVNEPIGKMVKLKINGMQIIMVYGLPICCFQ